MKSDVYGGEIDSEVFESLPHEIQLEVLNSVSRDLKYSVKKHEKELKKASPVRLDFLLFSTEFVEPNEFFSITNQSPFGK